MNIIEEMYNGDLFPIGTYSNSSKEYKKAMDSLVAAETELLNAYPQIRELFDKYQSAQIELISINNRQEFVNGFSASGVELGALFFISTRIIIGTDVDIAAGKSYNTAKYQWWRSFIIPIKASLFNSQMRITI